MSAGRSPGLDPTVSRIVARGMSLEERRCWLRAHPPVPTRSAESFSTARLERWRRWFTRDGAAPDGWKHFLADHALGAEELSALASVDVAGPMNLRWARVAQSIFTSLRKTCTREQRGFDHANNLALPVAQHAWQEFCHATGAQIERLLQPAAAAQLRTMLRLRLARSARQPVEWIWQTLGEPGRNRTVEDARKLFYADGLEIRTFDLLRCCPGLARVWSIQVEQWHKFACDFLRHAERFIGRAGQSCAARSQPVQWIEPDLSDPHHGGRTTLGVQFADRSRWFYKPRPGEHESRWFGLLRWLNDEGFCAPFQIVDIVDGGAHCWMPEVAHRCCRTRLEAAQCYFRAGALLALLQLLDGVDIHAQNMIVCGSQPVIIDLESLFHPRPPPVSGYPKMSDAVFYTGLLPVKALLLPVADSVSALGRRAPGPHSVRWRGKAASVALFADDVAAGFCALRHFLVETPSRVNRFEALTDRMRTLRWRRLPRPTGHYASILHASLSPQALNNGLERSLYLHAACRTGPLPDAQLRHEVACLERLDVPRFTGRAVGNGRQPSHPCPTKTAALIAEALRAVAE